jgi:hypothetical protein
VLFEYEKENNTIKDTLLEAVKQRANLRSANLRSAYLSGADLRSAYLSGADLSGADLSGAYLSGAYLSGADLSGADLSGANLRSADLRSAYLSGADLSGADLRSAYLSGADLSGADLSGAYLSGADLSGADLSGANLRSAYLRSADLSGANLSGADLRSAKEIPAIAIAQTRILPEGELIGYKKAYGFNTNKKVIIKLLIPSNAKRSSAFGRKCRAEFAEVLEIIGDVKARSDHDSSFTYEYGQIVRPTHPFDENWVEECASGIHFFITKVEAENY